ncbi:hypothetical protein LUZ60_013957 [Juncus effusus]|nr:hypothetical protein LUZ60_013957 [Juncus effusus]
MAEASQEPLPCKTLLLRVSIHCEGCKKKVKKVLQNVEGVYKVDIDSYQHKVTVNGNVDHDTLIRRLHKSGKQASIWPEPKKTGNQIPASSNDKKDQNKESSNKSKDKEPKEKEKEKESNDKIEKETEPAKDKSVDKEKEKEKVTNEDESKTKPKEEKTEEKKEKEKVKEKEKEKESEKPKENEKEKPKEAPKQGAENSNGKKKKEKKQEKQIENENENENNRNRGENTVREIHPSEPDQPGFMHPYSYPYPPQPIMSYHVAQPSSSRAYFQQPPTHHDSYNMNPYLYPYQNQNMHQYQNQNMYQYGPPSDYTYGSNEPSRREDSTLDYFNEENANSCSVM